MVILYPMKRPIFVRPLSDAECKTLEAGLRSPDAFTLRRCQILLASNRGQNAYQIAHELGCNPQTARNAIHAFNEKGLPEALQPGSRSIRILFTGLSILSKLRLCASCFTKTLANSANTVAFGLWRWLPRSASKKDSPKSGSRARPSGRRLRGWECAGSGPNAGSLPRIRSMQEKKAARPIDEDGGRASRLLGGGFSVRRPGGVGWLCPRCIAGARRESLCASSSSRSPKRRP
jgi:hypothetical protein